MKPFNRLWSQRLTRCILSSQIWRFNFMPHTVVFNHFIPLFYRGAIKYTNNNLEVTTWGLLNHSKHSVGIWDGLISAAGAGCRIQTFWTHFFKRSKTCSASRNPAPKLNKVALKHFSKGFWCRLVRCDSKNSVLKRCQVNYKVNISAHWESSGQQRLSKRLSNLNADEPGRVVLISCFNCRLQRSANEATKKDSSHSALIHQSYWPQLSATPVPSVLL